MNSTDQKLIDFDRHYCPIVIPSRKKNACMPFLEAERWNICIDLTLYDNCSMYKDCSIHRHRKDTWDQCVIAKDRFHLKSSILNIIETKELKALVIKTFLHRLILLQCTQIHSVAATVASSVKKTLSTISLFSFFSFSIRLFVWIHERRNIFSVEHQYFNRVAELSEAGTVRDAVHACRGSAD